MALCTSLTQFELRIQNLSFSKFIKLVDSFVKKNNFYSVHINNLLEYMYYK